MQRAFLRALGVLAILAASAVAAPAQADGGNLLANPSFEEGMYHVSMSNFIADGWSYWYESRAADDPRGFWLPEPEYGIISDRPGQAHSGGKSQRWFNTWAIHNAGVYQRVHVPDNAWLRFSIWMFNWSSQGDVFALSDGFHHKWVGVDPTGGTDAFSPNIVWGNEDRTMDVWVQLGVIAQAQGDTVTVFVREKPEYSVKHNDVLIDDAELVVIDPPTGDVVQPVAVATKKADTTAANDKPDNALDIGRIATTGLLDGAPAGKYAYFKFTYPGGETPYKINVQVSPDDNGLLSHVGFRVYGPTQGKVYVSSGLQSGLTPNVTGDLLVGEPGTYLVQLYNTNGGSHVDYRIWLTGKGLIGEVPTMAARTP